MSEGAGASPARPATGRLIVPALAAAAVLVCGGCAGPDPKPSAQPVSVARTPKPAEPADSSSKVPQAEIDAALSEMSSAIQHGDAERALAVGDALLLKKPPEEVRTQIERLRKVAKQQLLQAFYVDAVIRTEKDRVTIGEQIKGEVTLINVGTEPVVIEDSASGASGSASRTLLHLEVEYREFAPGGTIVREMLTSNVVVGRRISLPPGGRYAIPLELDTGTQNPSGTMLRNYDVGGSVFLAELKAGKETIYGQLQLKRRRVQVFPRNWEHLADRPAEKLAQAIAKRSPTHIPLAAALVPEQDKRQALRVLRDALADTSGTMEPATRTACCVACVVLTGEERKADPAVWIKRLDELLA